MAELFRYCIWLLGILQVADILTWGLKKAIKKRKKEAPFWRKVRWGIAAAMLVLVLALSQNPDVYAWLYFARKEMSNYEKLEMAMIYLANIKFWRLGYAMEVRLKSSQVNELSEEEKFNIGASCVVGGVMVGIIITLVKCGIMFALLFVAAMLLACIFAKPITLIIKK